MPRNICSMGRVRKKCDVLVYTFLLLLLTVLIPSPVHNQEYSYVQLPEGKRTSSEPSIDDVKAEIVRQARVYGVDEATSLRIAKCESSYRWDAKNSKGTAKGVYQFIDRTWKYIGAEGHQYDYKENIEQFMKWYPKNPHWWVCKSK